MIEELEEEKQSNQKWDLVRDIRDRSIFRAIFGRNLREANLSRADLNDAIVENAIFTDTTGLSKLHRVDLERRGAIFGDRPPVRVYK